MISEINILKYYSKVVLLQLWFITKQGFIRKRHREFLIQIERLLVHISEHTI